MNTSSLRCFLERCVCSTTFQSQLLALTFVNLESFLFYCVCFFWNALFEKQSNKITQGERTRLQCAVFANRRRSFVTIVTSIDFTSIIIDIDIDNDDKQFVVKCNDVENRRFASYDVWCSSINLRVWFLFGVIRLYSNLFCKQLFEKSTSGAHALVAAYRYHLFAFIASLAEIRKS